MLIIELQITELHEKVFIGYKIDIKTFSNPLVNIYGRGNPVLGAWLEIEPNVNDAKLLLTSSYAIAILSISFLSIKKRPIPATDMALIAIASMDFPNGICS